MRVVWPWAWLVTQQPPALLARVFVTTLILPPFLKPQTLNFSLCPTRDKQVFQIGVVQARHLPHHPPDHTL